jgi:hypothetical protein
MAAPSPGSATTGPRDAPAARPAPANVRRDWTLLYAVIAAVGVVALLALFTSPAADLLGDSAYAIPATMHGIASILFVVVATVVVYLAYLMYTNRLAAYRDARILSLLASFFALVTVMFGNWIYIYYRATGGPRSYFLETQPAVHEIFFELKEFLALFTLPLFMAATYVQWLHRDELRHHMQLRQATAVFLALGWLCLMVVFALGAAITKLRGV